MRFKGGTSAVRLLQAENDVRYLARATNYGHRHADGQLSRPIIPRTSKVPPATSEQRRGVHPARIGASMEMLESAARTDAPLKSQPKYEQTYVPFALRPKIGY